MEKFFREIGSVFTELGEPRILLGAVLFVALFTIIYYFLFKFLRENGAVVFVKIAVPLMVALGLALMCLRTYSGINRYFIFVPFIVMIVVSIVYSVEFKSAIWRKANLKFFGAPKHAIKNYSEVEVSSCIDEIIRALQNMSKNDIGAIIVLSSGNVPERILESGVEINSDITSQLIESIFFPKTPLHDGAMIITGTKIVAAGCFLPLSQKENLPKELGTRHRAGIGITENIDVTTLIVSEETGIISIVKGGNITRYADSELLRKTLSKFYWQDMNAR